MVDQFGLSFLHTFAPWPCLCFATFGKHIIPFQICSKGDIFIYDFIAWWKYAKISCTLYIAIPPCRSKAMNFVYFANYYMETIVKSIWNGLLIKIQIELIENLAFVINMEKKWIHWGVVCLDIKAKLLVTQRTFEITVELAQRLAKVT